MDIFCGCPLDSNVIMANTVQEITLVWLTASHSVCSSGYLLDRLCSPFFFICFTVIVCLSVYFSSLCEVLLLSI